MEDDRRNNGNKVIKVIIGNKGSMWNNDIKFMVRLMRYGIIWNTCIPLIPSISLIPLIP